MTDADAIRKNTRDLAIDTLALLDFHVSSWNGAVSDEHCVNLVAGRMIAQRAAGLRQAADLMDSDRMSGKDTYPDNLRELADALMGEPL